MPTATQIDPTRSATLRRAFIVALRRGYSRLRRDVYHLLRRENALAHRVPKRVERLNKVSNTRWGYETNPNKVKRFREWLRDRIGSTLAGDRLIEHYIGMSYAKGMDRGYKDVTKESDTTPVAEEYLSLTQDATVEKVKLLASRTFSELEGINQRMASTMSRILADGLASGHSLTKISERINREIGVTQKRAETIARTELSRAHAEGQLDTFERLGIKEVGAAVEWDTADDGKVCPLCAPLEGVILKIREARGMLPRHPNCRCAWKPVALKGQKREVERAIRRSQRAEKSKEWEPNQPITKRK